MKTSIPIRNKENYRNLFCAHLALLFSFDFNLDIFNFLRKKKQSNYIVF